MIPKLFDFNNFTRKTYCLGSHLVIFGPGSSEHLAIINIKSYNLRSCVLSCHNTMADWSCGLLISSDPCLSNFSLTNLRLLRNTHWPTAARRQPPPKSTGAREDRLRTAIQRCMERSTDVCDRLEFLSCVIWFHKVLYMCSDLSDVRLYYMYIYIY